MSPTGVVLAVAEVTDSGYRVLTPCSNEEVVTAGRPIVGGTVDVVLDPGHGGNETGARGPNGLTEKEVNLDIAQRAAARLELEGLRVLLTRSNDVRLTLAARAAIVNALKPQAFISVHHNAEPDGPAEGPGSETYFQIESTDSRRLSGLLYEELVDHLSVFDIDWVADTDAGAKFRTSSGGGDYYGILRRTAGVSAVLSEAAFISNPPEAELLATPEFRAAEAQAIADSVVRFTQTQDSGSGYSEPYARTSPAGPGGGTNNCEDPGLGQPG